MHRFAFAIRALILALVFLIPLGAHAALKRLPHTLLFGPIPVWTDGTTTADLFHPLGPGIESAGLLGVRVSTEMDQNSGNCKIRPAIRYSNDGLGWGGDVLVVAAYRSTPGIDYGSTYVDLSTLGATAGAYIQFGVHARNTSGTRIEHCNATVLIEPKEIR